MRLTAGWAMWWSLSRQRNNAIRLWEQGIADYTQFLLFCRNFVLYRQCSFGRHDFEKLDDYADKMTGDDSGVIAASMWKCRITGLFMELWITLFAGCGKAAFCFSMCCEQSYP